MIASRLERGLGGITIDALQRIALALGRSLLLELARDVAEAPRDAAHLAMQELILRLGRRAGYHGTFELPTRPADPWRSSDVGLADERRRLMVLVECWNRFGDIGASARSAERKRAEAEQLALAKWGEGARVAACWVVRSNARNRDLIARYAEVFARRFPGSSVG
jgi:hypothetical protein